MFRNKELAWPPDRFDASSLGPATGNQSVSGCLLARVTSSLSKYSKKWSYLHDARSTGRRGGPLKQWPTTARISCQGAGGAEANACLL